MPLHSIPNYRDNDTGRPRTRDGVGVVATATGISVTEYGDVNEHRTVITFANFVLAMADVGGTSSTGSQKIYDFPAAHILLRGALMNLAVTKGAGGLIATAALVASVGSAAVGTNNATLTSTEADIIASTTGTLVTSAGTFRNTGSITPVVADAISSALSAYLNVAAPDADSSANDTITLNGTITLFWGVNG